MKTLRLFWLAAILVTLAASCTKRTIPPPQSKTEGISSNRMKWDEAANSYNPYESDSFGVWHNLGLDYAISFKDSYQDHDEWFDEIPGLMEGFFAENVELDEQYWGYVGTYYPEAPDEVDPAIWSLDSVDYYLSSSQETYFSALIDSVEASTGFTDLMTKMVAWEAWVNASIGLSASEKKDLLYTGNMTRYSIYYWYYELNLTENTPWDGFSFNKRNAVLAPWGDIIDIAWADVGTGTKIYIKTKNIWLAIVAGLLSSIIKAIEIL